MVASGEVFQKLCSASPRGSKYFTTGFNFPAKDSRSALDSAKEVELAPLEVDGAKAAAEPAKREARSNFIVDCRVLDSLRKLVLNPGTCFGNLTDHKERSDFKESPTPKTDRSIWAR